MVQQGVMRQKNITTARKPNRYIDDRCLLKLHKQLSKVHNSMSGLYDDYDKNVYSLNLNKHLKKVLKTQEKLPNRTIIKAKSKIRRNYRKRD